MPHGDLGDQPLEPHPAGRAGPGLAQVLVDHQHPRGLPAKRDRPLHQPILQPGRLPMVEHLLAGGLAHIHHRQPLKMPVAHLAAQPLPRQQRGHGRPPSPARSQTLAPAVPTSGSRTATTRLASTASHPTATRRLASGSPAQGSLTAHCGARISPRRPRRPALLATRTGPQPVHDLDQPQQPLTSEYRRLSCLVSVHACILLGSLSRATSRSRTSWAGPTSRSAAPARSAATWSWSAARSASAGTPPTPPRTPNRSTRRLGTRHRLPQPTRPLPRPRGGPSGPHPARWAPAGSWPQALRRVRAWLTPWRELQRLWRAWSPCPPPPVVRDLLTWVAAGKPLYLYTPP